ncbi:hypothetical protein QN224_09530 [Sinorhizobium sp. 8-89]|uniref:hypothetical protein n=1 Tax=Sinorhizobium sp. 7-81 TaxID=3049087 RepID=UPI0024C2DBE3|nr:hypothetical protein [Sinorhizobium sp. 7-81]MDK1385646.1 hypothetical protein [Sinorhizobium sp. 7-81]
MIQRLLAACGLFFAVGAAQADETAFLGSLEGQWAGDGMVKVRINRSPINVSCTFNSQASGPALSMKGTCRGLIVVSRAVGADLQFNGSSYSGFYVGPSGRRAGLTGNRRGNAINLTIRWPREVNGDRSANLTLQKVGQNGMRLVTTDVDPRSGYSVVTSDINLRRQ